MPAAIKPAKSPKAEPDPSSLADKALLCLIARDLGKVFYKLSDSLQDQLEMELDCGEPIDMAERNRDEVVVDLGEIRQYINARIKLLDKKRFTIVDKYKTKNSIGVGLSARRYELKEVPA